MNKSVESKYRSFRFETEGFETESFDSGSFDPDSQVQTPEENGGHRRPKPVSVTLEIALDQEGAQEEKGRRKEPGYRVRLPDGTEHPITVRRHSVGTLEGTPEETLAGTMEITIAKDEAVRVLRVPFAVLEAEGKEEQQRVTFSYEGQTYTFYKASSLVSRSKRGAGVGGAASGLLTAPMAGVVSEVLVAEGQTVAAYQPLVVLEAMKVMTTLDAPFAGIIKHLHVRPRQQVVHGAPVVEVAAL